MVFPAEKKLLSGWGRYYRQWSYVFRPEGWNALQSVIKDERVPDLIARGLGRSYGDTALNEGGAVVDICRLNRFINWDEEKGILTCEAGVTLKEILDIFLPRGWLPYVCPGTKFITLGGAIANDIHGKNHHCEGTFGKYVVALELITPTGEILTCSRYENSEIFKATIGGIGLTGLIRTATIQLKKVPSAYLHIDIYQCKNFDDLLQTAQEFDKKYPYTVAWVDCLAQKENMGRGIVMGGTFANPNDLPSRLKKHPYLQKHKQEIKVPIDAPSWALTPRTVGIFNSWYYDWNKSRYELQPIEKFFFPLDRILEWNRIYGKRGFIQYQIVFPKDEIKGFKVLLESLSSSQVASFLAVLKRTGPYREGYLSFPLEGYSLALDIPNYPGTAKLVEDLDFITRRYGGRVYLAKDSLMKPDMFKESYPEWKYFAELKEKLDPDHRFSSSMARRLEIVPQRRRSPIC
ncbi:MAG: FAD-binding oxidoreductase [Candidatus Hydrogenedentes bacterium]|nr:FAD-binding oxidoreductase [Candidatus Hydrogenedentota bacterium]